MATAVQKTSSKSTDVKAMAPKAATKTAKVKAVTTATKTARKTVVKTVAAKAETTPVASKAVAKVAVRPAGRKVSRVLITQPKPDTEKSPYFDLARKYGLDLEFHPFIRVEGVSGRDFRRQRVDIAEYSAIIFTSRSAVDHFFRILEEMKVKVSQEMKYCCLTEAVALYLQKFILYRKRKVFFSADGSVQGLLDVIGKHKMEKYVLPTSDSGRNEIHSYLTKMNIPFAEVTLYHTVSNDITEIMGKEEYDMIVFFSPFSVQALFAQEPQYEQNGTLIGAFGPTTSKAVEDSGLRLDVKAPAPNAPSMVSALERFFETEGK
jgi:uroporphyrinogen-III synthase